MESHTNTVPGALNHHLGNGTLLEAFVEIAADLQVGVKLVSKLALRSIPLGLPVLIDCQAKSDRMYFLSQD